tara:strand:- start:1200 stop:1427 length:228 start_codon:yes stop_codon:yes gene_type:complete
MEEQQKIEVEDLIRAYNNNLGELDKLKKMIDKMAMNEAKHTVEIAERDVVIDNLRAMLSQAEVSQEAELNVSEEE